MQVMKNNRNDCVVPSVILMALFLLSSVPALPAEPSWTQWGGPHGDFTCDGTGLTETWPEAGPAEVWRREIGAGHSTILYDDGVVFTMYRHGEKDAVVAVNADTGAIVWKYEYDAPVAPGMLQDYGVGPHSSPLIAGDRIFTIGGMTHFHCLDKNTGKLLWSHHLSEKYGVSNMLRGYGSSPIAYKDLVIINAGVGQGAKEPGGLAAFKQDTGELVWKSDRLIPGYPTPVFTNVDGQDMIIDCLGFDRFALDPATGKTLWKSRVDRQSASIITSPLWIPPDKVFFSAGHGGGSRLYRMKRAEDGSFSAEELWYYNKFRIMHGNAVRIDDHVYGSSGDLGPAYLMAIDLNSGKLKWRERGFSKATLLLAGNRLIILDDQGHLALATATPEKLEIHAKAKVLEQYAWTAPTLIGTRLYLRDEHTLKCLDLGINANQ